LSPADAADVVQFTWLRLVENLDRIHDPERLGGWLATTARRECLRVIRLRGREQPSGTAGVFDRSIDDPVAGQIVTAERDRVLRRALSGLDQRCQALLRLLAAADPQSYEEIGAALGMPIGAIGPTRGRCLEKLRRSPELAELELR
jgi:RNA polymerase sigma factor (sigma-70 family)